MAELNNGEVIDAAMNAGPLHPDEALRRAQILVYNDLVEIYERKLAHLRMYPNIHPETREVIAMAADVVNDIASEILVELSADERAKEEEGKKE